MFNYRVFDLFVDWHNKKRLGILFGGVRRVDGMILMIEGGGFPLFDQIMFVLFGISFLSSDPQGGLYFDLSFGEGFLWAFVVVLVWAVLGSLGLSGLARYSYRRLLEQHRNELGKQEKLLEKCRTSLSREVGDWLRLDEVSKVSSLVRSRFNHLDENLMESLHEVRMLMVLPATFSLSKQFLQQKRVSAFNKADDLVPIVEGFCQWLSVLYRVRLTVQNIAVIRQLNQEFPHILESWFDTDAEDVAEWFDELMIKLSSSEKDWDSLLSISLEYRGGLLETSKRLVVAYVEGVLAQDQSDYDKQSMANSIQIDLMNRPEVALVLMRRGIAVRGESK